jgi:hypothetical protein
VDQTFDTGFEFDERTIFGDVRDRTLKLRADWVFGNCFMPRLMRCVSLLIRTI